MQEITIIYKMRFYQVVDLAAKGSTLWMESRTQKGFNLFRVEVQVRLFLNKNSRFK